MGQRLRKDCEAFLFKKQEEDIKENKATKLEDVQYLNVSIHFQCISKILDKCLGILERNENIKLYCLKKTFVKMATEYVDFISYLFWLFQKMDINL